MTDARDFEIDGFLSKEVQEAVTLIRGANAQWFDLATDLNRAVQRAAIPAGELRGTTGDPKVVATLLFLRAAQAFQGSVIMAERGMVAEARTLARACLEAGFCIAAILEDPEEFLPILRADFHAARKSQARFILSEREAFSAVDADSFEQLEAAIEEIGKVRNISVDDLTKKGPLRRQYLLYKRLSNDAVHVSAKSLSRHLVMNEASDGWRGFHWGPTNKGDVADTLSAACQAMIGVGVGYTQLVENIESNAEFGPLAERYAGLTSAED